MEITPAKAREAIVDIIKAGLVTMITGSPGVGKSDLVQGIGKEFKLKVIDVRLAQIDPTELSGFPMLTDDRMDYAPPEQFPLQGIDKVPKGYDGFLLFLDEFSSAPMAVQAAAYKLVLDRKVGKYDLHKKVAIICAGNRISDGAVSNRLSTAMQSRMVHLDMVVSSEDWLAWAATHNIDYRITSFIEFRPDVLHKFDPDHNDQTFSCPRTWEFANKLIAGKTDLLQSAHVLSGTLSEGVAREFISFSGMMSSLPTIANIIADPKTIEINNDPAMLYAISHMISAKITDKNIAPVMQYLERLPIEFMTISIKTAIKRDPDIFDFPEIKFWMNALADEIFA